jgi:hypothetical protein
LNRNQWFVFDTASYSLTGFIEVRMLLNPEIPPILGPGKQNPANHSPLYPEYDFIDPYGTHVLQGHYWRRIKATHIPCGESSYSLEIAYKRGVSQVLLAEVASTLELAVAPLKSTLSSKISASNTFTDEDTLKAVRDLKPRPNHAITFAEWHKIFRSNLRRRKKLLWFDAGVNEQVIDIGTEETFPDTFEYLDPSCGLPKIEEDADKGYSEVYTLDLGFARLAIQGRRTSSGKVALADIPGQYLPEKATESKEMLSYLRSIDRAPDGKVVLSESLGSVKQFYGWSQGTGRMGSSAVPWILAAGAASLLAFLVKSRKQSQASDVQDEGHGFELHDPAPFGTADIGYDASGRVVPQPAKAPEVAKEQRREFSNSD